jgi:hypothetical protein
MLQNQSDEPFPLARPDIPVMEPSSWDVRMMPECDRQPARPSDRKYD